MGNDLATPSALRQFALAFPDKAKAAIARIEDADEAADGLAKAEAMANYVKRIKATGEEVNHIQYGKLLLAAKYGELNPAPSPTESGKKGGGGCPRGGAGDAETPFGGDTLANYRKLARYQKRGRIDDYFDDLVTTEHEQEMSIAGFMRFVGTNIKGSQNKGVIEWYTPKLYIEAARATMGSIDFDPASSEVANQIVKAATFLDENNNGLEIGWGGNVFLNPPFRADLIAAFVNRLCEFYENNHVEQAVLLTNNNTDTRWWHQAAEWSRLVCFTKGRVPFYNPHGEAAAPTNGQTFFYFGNRTNEFRKEFAEIGTILSVG